MVISRWQKLWKVRRRNMTLKLPSVPRLRATRVRVHWQTTPAWVPLDHFVQLAPWQWKLKPIKAPLTAARLKNVLPFHPKLPLVPGKVLTQLLRWKVLKLKSNPRRHVRLIAVPPRDTLPFVFHLLKKP